MELTFLLGSLPDGVEFNGRPAAGEIIVLEVSREPDAIQRHQARVRELKATPSGYKGFGILVVPVGDWRLVPLEEAS